MSNLSTRWGTFSSYLVSTLTTSLQNQFADTKIMAFKTVSAFIFLFSLLFSSYSASHPIHFFPSSLRPEAPSLSTRNELYETKYFTQTLDHFNFHPQSYQTFQQRYLINSSYWGGAKIKAPIFVYTGNEGDIEWFTQNTGFMFDNAPYFQAFLVFIEVLSCFWRRFWRFCFGG